MKPAEEAEGADGPAKQFRIGEKFNPYKLFKGIFVPEHICRYRGLSLGAKMTYGRLCRYAGEDGAVYPSIPTVARELGISETQARGYLRELENQKFIGVDRKHRHYSAKGTGGSYSYSFLWHAAFNGDLGEKRKAPPVRYGGVPLRKTEPLPLRLTEPVTPSVNRTQRESALKRVRVRESLKADTSLPIAEKRDSHAVVSLASASKPKPRERTDAEFEVVEEFLGDHLPEDIEEWPGGRSDGCPQHWMAQAILDAAPNYHAGEILHFLESKIDSGWCAANWKAYPAVVRHEFERRDSRAQGIRWSESDLATVRTVITRYMEGEEPPLQFEHSCELRANGATQLDVVGLLERRWKNKEYRLGAKHGPGAVGGQRSRWNWFLKVIGNEFSETERAHLPEPPARAKRDESMHASGLGKEQFETMSDAF
jgi:Helix-turn-helix domain